MEAVNTGLFSPFWFLNIFFVSLVGLFLHKLISKPIDKGLSKISSSWRCKSEKRKLQFDNLIDSLYLSEYELLKFRVDEIRAWIFVFAAVIIFLVFHIFIIVSPYSGNNLLVEVLLFPIQTGLAFIFGWSFGDALWSGKVLRACYNRQVAEKSKIESEKENADT